MSLSQYLNRFVQTDCRYNRSTKSSHADTSVSATLLAIPGIPSESPAAECGSNLINNGRLTGALMHLCPDDVVCCPPPLFHTFGLTLGFHASLCAGSSLVLPADRFNPKSTLDAIVQEGVTTLLGVPTMFSAMIDILPATGYTIDTVSKGCVGGAPPSPTLLRKIRSILGIKGILIGYGMTETSPATFMDSLDDPVERRGISIGKIMPHTSAKVVDRKGNITRLGQRGELCVSGYMLQKGYWKDEKSTESVMKWDENGKLWMFTGDEVLIDDDGYGHITGRIKDIIIRGVS